MYSSCAEKHHNAYSKQGISFASKKGKLYKMYLKVAGLLMSIHILSLYIHTAYVHVFNER